MEISDLRWDLCFSGVHVQCKPAEFGDGTPDKCPKAGTVERLHAHNFDGPLVCGCPDFGT